MTHLFIRTEMEKPGFIRPKKIRVSTTRYWGSAYKSETAVFPRGEKGKAIEGPKIESMDIYELHESMLREMEERGYTRGRTITMGDPVTHINYVEPNLHPYGWSGSSLSKI